MTQSKTQPKEEKRPEKVLELPIVKIGEVDFINLKDLQDGLSILGNVQIRTSTTKKIFTLDAIGVGNSAAGNTAGNIVKKIEIFNKSGTSLGYLAVYDAITTV